MKKIFLILSVTMIAYACGNQDSGAASGADSSGKQSTATTQQEPAAKADVTENPDYVAGLELIAKSDCLTCHNVEDKKVGPAYRDVANKYNSDDRTITQLATKVIKGGSGVWGPIPMTPHAALSEADAKQMVKYILLLKNK